MARAPKIDWPAMPKGAELVPTAAAHVAEMIQHEQSASAALAEMGKRLADAAERLAAAAERLAGVASAQQQAPPTVLIDAPKVTVDAPRVNVAPANIEIPEPPAPVVEVRAVFPKKVTKNIHRDSRGLIDRVDEEWSF